MLKYVTFAGVSETGEPLVTALQHSPASMIKEASAVSPELQKFIDGLTKEPTKLYVLVNALGAGEFYGPNVNGDYFEEAELLKEGPSVGYKSFLNAGVFRHHANKDKDKSMGAVIFSVYNKKMRRVELVIAIDRKRAEELGHKDLLDELDSGKHPSVSMGCRVKYDVCYVCGHKSATREDYCTHAKESMGKVLDDGKIVCVKNPDPNFFDLSFVAIGADKIGHAMTKIAFVSSAVLSTDAAKEVNLRYPYKELEKRSSKRKLAEILKRVSALSAKVTDKADLPRHVLRRLSKHAMDTTLTTLAANGIVLKPHEFQFIALTKLGYATAAEEMNSRSYVFSSVDSGKTYDMTKIAFDNKANYSPAIELEISEYVPERSVFLPFVLATTEKLANAKIDVDNTDVLNWVASQYNGYRIALLEKFASIVGNVSPRSKTIKDLLGNFEFEDRFSSSGKLASSSIDAFNSDTRFTLAFLPLAYLYGSYVKRQQESGGPVSMVDNFIAQHPNFTASMASGLVRLGVALEQTGDLGALAVKLLGAIK